MSVKVVVETVEKWRKGRRKTTRRTVLFKTLKEYGLWCRREAWRVRGLEIARRMKSG